MANADSCLINEYYFHPIVNTPWLFLFNSIFFFYLCPSAGFRLAFLYVNLVHSTNFLQYLGFISWLIITAYQFIQGYSMPKS